MKRIKPINLYEEWETEKYSLVGMGKEEFCVHQIEDKLNKLIAGYNDLAEKLDSLIGTSQFELKKASHTHKGKTPFPEKGV